MSYAVRAEAAEAVVAEIATAGGRAIAVAADIADSAAFRAMVTRAEAELGPVTILVNNAGVAWQGTLHLRPRAGRAHAPSKRGRRDPCHARSDGEHSGAALWADRQSGLDGGDRHRTVWQCILRGNEGRGNKFQRGALPWSWASTASP